MRTLVKTLLVSLIFGAALVYADNPPLVITESDGSPSGVATKLKFFNGSLTKSGSVFTVGSIGASQMTTNAKTQTINFVISGGTAPISTGGKGYLVTEYDCTIATWTIVADQSGSIVVDVKRATYSGFPTTSSIVGAGNKPTLSTAQKNLAAPASWTSTTISAGDILEFNVDSVSTVTRVTLSLRVTKT